MAARSNPDQVVLVGGGRWARVLADEISRLLPPEIPLTIVSRSAADQMRAWASTNAALASRQARGGLFITNHYVGTPAAGELGVAIIANRPRDHFSAATELITRGYHLLVEKPLCTDPAAARHLVWLGRHCRRAILTGLVQLFAPYICAFRERIPFARDSVTGFAIEWADPAEEERYGERKKTDTSVGIALDLVPHVWSIVHLLLKSDGDAPVACDLISSKQGGADVSFRLEIKPIAVNVRLTRNATVRRRRITMNSGSQTATLDFGDDPAIIAITGQEPVQVPHRLPEGGALARQLTFFFNLAGQVRDGCSPPPHLAIGEHNVKHVDLAWQMEQAVRRTQQSLVQSALSNRDRADVIYALRSLQD